MLVMGNIKIDLNICAKVCRVSLAILIVIGHLSEALYMKSCSSNESSNIGFCVESSGFYYNLGKGPTWNVSFTEGEGLQERVEFLKFMEKNSCPLTVSANSCGNECCFCDLGIPLPQHPISRKQIIPNEISCKNIIKLRNAQECHSVPAHRYYFPEDPTAMPFLSIFYHNLERLSPIYNNPSQLSKDSLMDEFNRNKFRFSWRNYSNRVFINSKRVDKSQTTNLIDDANDMDIPSSSATPLDFFEEIYGIKYSLSSRDEMDIVTVENWDNLTFSFSGPTECLTRHRRWDMYPPCTYRIDVTALDSCEDIRKVINASSILISRYIFNGNVTILEPSVWLEQDEFDDIENRTRETEMTCCGIPHHVRLTSIWVEGENVSTLISMEKFSNGIIENEVQLTGSVSQRILNKEEYTDMSRFWAKFYFGECLYRKCWRDLWNVVPEELLENSGFLENSLNFRWGLYLPAFLVVLVTVMWSCIASFYEAEF